LEVVNMPTLEDRVRELEAQMQEVLATQKSRDQQAGWEQIIGSFSESEGFDEAMRLGREYRDSLRPDNDEKSG
jgi:hypothetical protein